MSTPRRHSAMARTRWNYRASARAAEDRLPEVRTITSNRSFQLPSSLITQPPSPRARATHPYLYFCRNPPKRASLGSEHSLGGGNPSSSLLRTPLQASLPLSCSPHLPRGLLLLRDARVAQRPFGAPRRPLGAPRARLGSEPRQASLGVRVGSPASPSMHPGRLGPQCLTPRAPPRT